MGLKPSSWSQGAGSVGGFSGGDVSRPTAGSTICTPFGLLGSGARKRSDGNGSRHSAETSTSHSSTSGRSTIWKSFSLWPPPRRTVCRHPQRVLAGRRHVQAAPEEASEVVQLRGDVAGATGVHQLDAAQSSGGAGAADRRARRARPEARAGASRAARSARPASRTAPAISASDRMRDEDEDARRASGHGPLPQAAGRADAPNAKRPLARHFARFHARRGKRHYHPRRRSGSMADSGAIAALANAARRRVRPRSGAAATLAAAPAAPGADRRYRWASRPLPIPTRCLRSLGRERYVSLATFRRDGRAVETPVWVVEHRGAPLRVHRGGLLEGEAAAAGSARPHHPLQRARRAARRPDARRRPHRQPTPTPRRRPTAPSSASTAGRCTC